MSQLKLNQDEKVKVLVVDDEAAIVNFVAETLDAHGYMVESSTDSEAVLHTLAEQDYDLAFIDINMPGVSGVELSREFLKRHRKAEIIIITGAPDEKNLDPCLGLGLTHFLFKPFNKSQLIYTAYAALHLQRFRRLFHADREKIKQSKLVGISPVMRELRREIKVIGKTDIPVLILGETGTGKEVVANEIHENSLRSEKKFLPINCAMFASLAESELFGHAKGAFTGAVSARNGHVGEAHGGTLFLDEIGDLSTDIQAKLLRFLDTGEFMRVGESKIRHADIRIIAATNRNIEEMCSNGNFRDDLYFRLAGSTIRTAPLAERKEDIIPLIWHFLDQFGMKHNVTFGISADSCECLAEMEWPGNVRQLKQTLYKISQLAHNKKILLHDVQKVFGDVDATTYTPFKEAKQMVIDEFESSYLLRTLQLSRGNLKKALELSGMHKKNFYTKINKLGLLLKDFHAHKNE